MTATSWRLHGVIVEGYRTAILVWFAQSCARGPFCRPNCRRRWWLRRSTDVAGTRRRSVRAEYRFGRIRCTWARP